MKWAIAAVIVGAASLATLEPSAVRADAPTRDVQSVDMTLRSVNGTNGTNSDDGAIRLGGASSRPPTISVANASLAEEGGSIVFTVRISRPTSKRVTVRYTTADGSATAGSDYSPARGKIVFKPS